MDNLLVPLKLAEKITTDSDYKIWFEEVQKYKFFFENEIKTMIKEYRFDRFSELFPNFQRVAVYGDKLDIPESFRAYVYYQQLIVFMDNNNELFEFILLFRRQTNDGEGIIDLLPFTLSELSYPEQLKERKFTFREQLAILERVTGYFVLTLIKDTTAEDYENSFDYSDYMRITEKYIRQKIEEKDPDAFKLPKRRKPTIKFS